MPGTVKYFTKRCQAANHLKNGNFVDVPKSYTSLYNRNGGGTVQVFRTVYEYAVTTQPPTPYFHPSTAVQKRIPGVYVRSSAPSEQFLAFWDIWGAGSLIALNEGKLSLDGGSLVTLTFNENGVVNFKQAIESFDKFRGKKVTMALGGSVGKGTVKVSFKIDTGSSVLEGRPFYSRYFGKYTRLLHIFDMPLAMSKCDVYIVAEGRAGEIVSMSGAVLAIGEYRADLPYSDNIPNAVIPSGTVILWSGASCPSGYRAIEDDAFLYAYLGDPNGFMGYDFGLESRPDHSLGQNRHDHTPSRDTEDQPAAFELVDSPFPTPLVKDEAVSTLSVNPVVTNPSYAGPTDAVLPRDHTHLISVLTEEVVPPNVKYRACEKI